MCVCASALIGNGVALLECLFQLFVRIQQLIIFLVCTCCEPVCVCVCVCFIVCCI